MSEDALEQAIGQRILRAVDNRILKLTILPTEQCNFRCTYCYEDFLKPRMSPEVVGGLKALMTHRAPTLKLLDLRWFGGEPLLAFREILEVNQHAQELARTHPGLEFVAGITTNAWLLDRSRFESLLASGVDSYQISLDGYGAEHDRTRKRADGSGTFDRIWSNLLALRSVNANFRIVLRVHFTPSTFDAIKVLVEKINTEFGQDRRFGVFFKALARLGGPNDAAIERSPWEWQRRAKTELSALLARGEDGVSDPTVRAYVCYAAEANHLVVRSDGSLARCTVAFNDPRNQVGTLHPDGTLSIDVERSRLWFAGLESRDQTTLYCPLNTLAPLRPQEGDKAKDRTVAKRRIPVVYGPADAGG